jgi:hypothetical protein
MGPDITRQRFIPFRKQDVVDMCVSEHGGDEEDDRDLRQLVRILGAVFHFEYHERLEALKETYAPFDPDPDTRIIRQLGPEELERCRDRFRGELRSLLEAANFAEMTEADLDKAFDTESLLAIRLHVNFDDFEEVTFYRRGEEVRTEEASSLFGLRRRTVTFHNYDRVVVYVRFRERSYFEDQDRSDLAFQPGSTILKMFQNIPRADLEMLFPNTEVRMRPIDKLVIGVPAVVSGLVIFFTKLAASLGLVLLLAGAWLGVRDEPVVLDQGSLVALGASLGAAGAFLYRQFTKFKNRKIRFMKTLADDLYFKNLDNDAGVFHNLLDAAEDEEVKEALVAYCFLLSGGAQEPGELDAAVEAWFAERWHCQLDFDISDALGKLERLEVVREDHGRFTAVPIVDARRRLDQIWDTYFPWSEATNR